MVDLHAVDLYIGGDLNSTYRCTVGGLLEAAVATEPVHSLVANNELMTGLG